MTMRPKTPLDTDYANETVRTMLAQTAAPEVELYCDVVTLDELDATRHTEALAEDRFIAAITGALESEIWT